MKIKQLLAGIFALGLITSCSENLPDEPGKILENETKTFVKISLVNTDGGTRAEAGEFADNLFEDGSDDENAVKRVKLLFFDASRNYVGTTNLTNPTPVEDGSLDLTTAKVITTVATVNLPENTNHPRYVLAFVNPTSVASDLTNQDKIEDIMKIIRSEGTMSTDGMTMNNSVYFDETSGLSRFATEVDFTTQFFKTEDEAKAAPAVDITVERVQAKVRLNVTKNEKGELQIQVDKVKDDASKNGIAKYELEFVPEDWFVNATEKRTFLLKNFRNDEINYLATNQTSNGWGFTFTELQTKFGTNGGRDQKFNEARRKRSYWAIDPTYFNVENTTLYPSMSYDVKNGNNVNPDGKTYPLNYYSYNQGIAKDAKALGYAYCFENTMSNNTLKSDRAKSAMTSVVLLGHYNIKDITTGETVFDGKNATGKTFYINHVNANTRDIFLTEKDAMSYFLERSGSLLYYPVPVLEEGTGNPTSKVDYQPLRAAHAEKYNLYDLFELVHPSVLASDVIGQSLVSEQWRTLRFKKDLTDEQLGRFYVYDQIGDGYDYVKLTREKYENLQKTLYSAYGSIESFKEGKAYFNVPLKHIFYNPTYYGNSGTSNEFNAEKVLLGDYGVVRNHVYDLTINKISGLGSGIGDLNQPIVPPTEVDKYYISCKLNILKWRIVGQSVDL